MPGGATDRLDAKDAAPDATALRTALSSASPSVGHEEPGQASRAPSDLFRIYGPEDLFDPDGYPFAWQTVKHLVRELAGGRCVRCGHPYEKGDGEWSPCDAGCSHLGPVRYRLLGTSDPWRDAVLDGYVQKHNFDIQARWRILTVHHLNGDKADLRWWNLVSLCQRCHLAIQAKVKLDRPWPFPHTGWFRPYVAAFYAVKYLGLELSPEATDAFIGEILAFGQARELENWVAP